MPVHISIVIPVYGCRTALVELYFRLKQTLEKITENFEIIMVNDSSPDGAWETILEIALKDSKVKGIDLSRNFGQHYALTAGLDCAKGEWVVVMDCDLQDQPEEIIKLYNKAMEGFDIVLGLRENRNDNFLKKYLSRLYYAFLSYLTNAKIDHRVGTFRILSKSVVNQFVLMRESFRFFGAMIDWLGFRVGHVEVEHKTRNEGKSSYTFKKSINLALNGVLSFSDKPLKLTIKFGLFIVIISSAFILYKIAIAFFYDSSAIGWSSLIASIFFSTGIIVSILGVIGLYIGRIFGQVKQRPLYIIKETTNISNNE